MTVSPVAYPVRPADLPTFELRDALIDVAECRFDPELHTGPDAFTTEADADREVREAVAREVCAGCPVRGECLELALRTLPEGGVWAGFTADEIAVLAAARLLDQVA
ncbi:WhiB family transcriptional regulator [Thermomonospora amylolytica]|uniref:WhiB family transcriptional regulator n=1 Tax=Thermomonospora amylolytica TaxID=1411117 RepID=UPI0013005A8A|nr:WhiB family transcriptional regulator [Thermomonospora amylolytica]